MSVELTIGPCDTSCIGFFDDAPNTEELAHQPGPWSPPLHQLPAVAVGDALLLARCEELAVGITGIWAFQTGFEFWLSSQFRRREATLEDFTDRPLHIGIQFADGRKVANVGRAPCPAAEPAGPIMRSKAMGGGRSYLERSYWVWPLPPVGPLTFVCEWAAYRMSEKSMQVDTEPILRAAWQSIKLWPEDAS